jgi:hypothetical protein
MGPKQQQLKTLLQIWMLCFLSASVVFFLFGKKLIITLNNFGIRLFPQAPLASIEANPFWMALVMSLMLTLILICYLTQQDIENRFILVVPLLFSKFISTVFFSLHLLLSEKAFAYFVGALTDGSIFLITYYFYARARKERLSRV